MAKQAVVPLSEKAEVRIARTTFQDEPRLDIRQYRILDASGEMRPTKHGVTVPKALVPAFLAELTSVVEPLTVQTVDDGTYFALCKNGEEARFHRTEVYLSEPTAALNNTDELQVWRVRVKDNVVVHAERRKAEKPKVVR